MRAVGGPDSETRRAVQQAGRKRLALGLLLVAVFWWVNWQSFRWGPVTVWAFFPLWLGYILVADGLAASRTGTSLFARDRRRFIELFAYSVPLWWLFEYVNGFIGNWTYVGAESVDPRLRVMFASMSFSTVIPAVFVTTELIVPRLPERLAHGPRWSPTPRSTAGTFVAGVLLFGALTTMPQWFYPAAWICVVLMVEPVIYLLGWPSLIARVSRGDWRLVVALAAAALACGVFWEMWNIYSSPKWVYEIPYLGFGKIFEMPILGYGGYLPFGLEVYCVYQLLSGIRERAARDFPGWP